MNNHDEYRRYQQRSTPPLESVTAEASHLGVHGDPSLGSPGAATTVTGRRIAWVRPTELHAYADGVIGRGIDMHAEFIRQAIRAPGVATRSARGVIAPSPSNSPAADREGLSL